MSSRVIMLGLDGMDWYLMNDWIDDGHLPTFAGLLRQSRTLFLGKANRPLPGSIWTDIATGVSAAAHRYVHEEQIRPGTYIMEKIDARHVAAEPFHKTLSAAGKRCAVVDFPVDFPIEGFNGIQVIDWGSEFKLWHFETRPLELAKQLNARYGTHPLTNYGHTDPGLTSLVALKHKLQRGITIKQRIATDLIRDPKYDLVFVNFCELHKAGHFFWRFHDRAHPDFTAGEPELVDSLRTLYEDLDRALGEVIAEIDPNDHLILVTDRGMYADHRGDHLIEEILAKLGFAQTRVQATQASVGRSWRSRLLGRGPIRKAIKYVGHHLISSEMHTKLLPFHRALTGGAPALDWSRTRVFLLPNVGNSYLRVNVLGREPHGIVNPGAEYDALLAEVAERLQDLVNPDTGERAVEGVYFPARQFTGPYAQELPDIAVVWSAQARIHALTSEATGLIRGEPEVSRTGNHRPEGFALFRGPTVAAGPGVLEGDARQIPAAVFAFLGLEAPRHYEMRPPDFVEAAPTDHRAPLAVVA